MRKVNEELTKFIFDHDYRNQLVIDKLNEKLIYNSNGIECSRKWNYEPLKAASGSILAPQRHRPAFHVSKPNPAKLATVWLFDPSTEDLESYERKVTTYGYNLKENIDDFSLLYNINECPINQIREVYVLIYTMGDYVDDNLKQVYKNDFINYRRLRIIGRFHETIVL